jgi:broad specificity phosphatase PhoE
VLSEAVNIDFMKLYFARHGQTDGNASNGKVAMEYDEPLNKIGVEQAEDLAKKLKGIQFDAIASSPLMRTLQTAEIINKNHNLPIKLDDSWAELKANSYIDVNVWQDLFDFDKNVQIENSETVKDFFSRIYGAIDKLKREYSDQTVLVVSHGGPQHALYAYAHKLPLTGNLRISPMRTGDYRVFEL